MYHSSVSTKDLHGDVTRSNRPNQHIAATAATSEGGTLEDRVNSCAQAQADKTGNGSGGNGQFAVSGTGTMCFNGVTLGQPVDCSTDQATFALYVPV